MPSVPCKYAPVFVRVTFNPYLCRTYQPPTVMTPEKRLYPIGIQTFSEIRTKHYLYIDKT